MNSMYVRGAISLLVLAPMVLTAQVVRERDAAPLKNWAAPLYWQPTQAERAAATPLAALPTNVPSGSFALVFVAMTPCRLVDTRAGLGFSGAFGPPSLIGTAPGRTFPIQSSTTCSIPSLAQAYSFNVTVVPGNSVGFITTYPTGQTQPLAATLVWQPNVVVSNAAIVAAGGNGSVDVYANASTDLVIDINGYYAPPGDLLSNTALGAGALANNTTGNNNTASGVGALQNNTTGDSNTASGYNVLYRNTTGFNNTATGENALFDNITGSNNTANGFAALFANITGTNNTGSGWGAIARNTTGNGNTASGFVALNANTTGNDNTASGQDALYSNTTGSNNIAIGYNSALNVSGGNSNNIHLGSKGAASDSGAIRIGGNPALGDPLAQSSFFAAGVRGASTGNNDAIPVVIDSNGQLGTVSSSRRFKEDIQDMGEASRGLLRLRPVAFRYKKPFDDGSKPIQYGLIAEEVEEIYPDLVAHSADGQIESVKYQVLDSMLLNELQKQAEKIRQQAEQNRSLEDRLAALEALLSKAASPVPLAAQ